MPLNDDDLDRLLRGANPARTPVDATPDFALLDRILSDAPRAKFRRAPFAFVAAPIAAVLVAVLAFVLTSPFGQSPAAAYGPPPLQWTPTQQSLPEVAAMAHERLARAAGAEAAVRASTVTGWNLSVNEAGEPDEVSSISPLVTELTWNEDLTGSRVVTAGRPFPVEGNSLPSDAVAEGTVIDVMEFGPGEYPALAPDAGTLNAAGFRDLLAAYAPADAGSKAGDAMLGIADILGEWTLTNAQHGYLLDALLQYDGLTVLGTTEDRLGRKVIGLRSDAALRPSETTTLLISAETGRIVGMETAASGSDASVPVPIGTVINYNLWKDSE